MVQVVKLICGTIFSPKFSLFMQIRRWKEWERETTQHQEFMNGIFNLLDIINCHSLE